MILKLESLGEYAKYLNDHPEERETLYDDVLISITSFFRDFEAFEALKTQVFPAIVKDKGNKGTTRMWAPGCSMGEGNYSLAIAARYWIELQRRPIVRKNAACAQSTTPWATAVDNSWQFRSERLHCLTPTQISCAGPGPPFMLQPFVPVFA